MKSRKTATHVNLMNEVTRQLSEKFIPDPQAIKKRIESLIEVRACCILCLVSDQACLRGNTLTERRMTENHIFTRHRTYMFFFGCRILACSSTLSNVCTGYAKSHSYVYYLSRQDV